MCLYGIHPRFYDRLLTFKAERIKISFILKTYIFNSIANKVFLLFNHKQFVR